MYIYIYIYENICVFDSIRIQIKHIIQHQQPGSEQQPPGLGETPAHRLETMGVQLASAKTDEAKVARDPSDTCNCGDGYGTHGNGDGNGWKCLHVKAAVRNVCKGCVTCLVCKSTLCFKTHVCECV